MIDRLRVDIAAIERRGGHLDQRIQELTSKRETPTGWGALVFGLSAIGGLVVGGVGLARGQWWLLQRTFTAGEGLFTGQLCIMGKDGRVYGKDTGAANDC